MRVKTFSGRALLWALLFVFLCGAATWVQAGDTVAAQDGAQEPRGRIQAFERVDAAAGWVWHSGELDLSEDGGATWRRITPGDPLRYGVAGVQFADAAQGWVLLAARAPGLRTSGAEATGEQAPAVLARTGDGGRSWQFAALPQALAEALAGAKAVYLLPQEGKRGWLAAQLGTSSNFSRGVLWYTADGGASWEERSLPLGEPVQFGAGEIGAEQAGGAQVGILAGGPTGDKLWRTRDGGVTWEEMALPRHAAAGERVQAYTPLVARDGSQVVLPLLIRNASGQRVEWHRSRDGGTSWELAQPSAPAGSLSESLFKSDARAWLAAQGVAVLPPVPPLPFFANTTLGDGSRLVQVKMVTAAEGWALAERPDRSRVLLATENGGQTWQELALPPANLPAEEQEAEQAGSLGAAGAWAMAARTSVARGPGFDICNLPTVGELAAWYAESPYRSVNLYIGGVLRFCKNEDLSAGKLKELAAQGWTFMPTWVGPQAPCTPYRSRFSSDPGEAYGQGVAEAEAALAAAAGLELTEGDGSGTIIYYDLEAYNGTDEACVRAVQAFVSGWSSRLRERGSQAGLYGSACNPPMGRYAGIEAPPDAIWMAAWNREAFDPQMTVWNLSCIDNSLWARSQRIRQYTNSHDETWGGITLEIDSNVLDSIVADLEAEPPTPTPTSTPIPTPTFQPTVVVETPRLEPVYADGMCGAGWHLLVNARGYPAYLAANWERNGTIPPPGGMPAGELSAAWEPLIAVDGLYRVEAYVPGHDGIQWLCPEAFLPTHTASAYYTVRHAGGTAEKVASQAVARNGWLLLGVYPFRAGLPAQVMLETATDEGAATRTVAASALRVTRVDGSAAGSQFLYLPQVNRQ